MDTFAAGHPETPRHSAPSAPPSEGLNAGPAIERALAGHNPEEVLPEFLESLFDGVRRDGREIDFFILRPRYGRPLGSGLRIGDMARFLTYPDAHVSAHFADLVAGALRNPSTPGISHLPPEDRARILSTLERLKYQGSEWASCEDTAWAVARITQAEDRRTSVDGK